MEIIMELLSIMEFCQSEKVGTLGLKMSGI